MPAVAMRRRNLYEDVADHRDELALARRPTCCSVVFRHTSNFATSQDIAGFENALASNRPSLRDLDRLQTTGVAFHCVLAMIPRNPVILAIHAASPNGCWISER